MSRTLAAARARSEADARCVLFGADVQGAGFSQSQRGGSRTGVAPFAARAVRQADDESPSLPESLDEGEGLFDLGDLSLPADVPGQLKAVGDTVERLSRAGKRFVCLGGDHLVKYACLEGLARVLPRCGVVYLDAHPDNVPEDRLFYGSILHHAWKLRGLAPSRTSLLALRQVNLAEKRALTEQRPGIVWARDFTAGVQAVAQQVLAQLSDVDCVFLSIDLDGLSPADAPAVEAPYPGGPGLLEVLEVFRLVAQRKRVVGMDVSEFLVDFDPARLTALTTARLVKEVAALP